LVILARGFGKTLCARAMKARCRKNSVDRLDDYL